jgi:LacI family transcriptional regulator
MRTVKSAGLERKLERWLGSLPRPAAIFTCADFVARQIMDCCRRIGISVPEDAAVLGVDNDLAICDLTSPRLSSIPQNMRRIGFDAARLLHGIMKGRRRPRAPVLIPPREVVVRQSTDSIVVEDARLAAVLRRIRSPERGEQSLRTLAKEAGMSRQWLDRRFRESLGATPSELIRRRKLAVARSLLIETHLPIQTIARRAGFTCGENLSRFFRQHMGMSPGEYRLRHGFVE